MEQGNLDPKTVPVQVLLAAAGFVERHRTWWSMTGGRVRHVRLDMPAAEALASAIRARAEEVARYAGPRIGLCLTGKDVETAPLTVAEVLAREIEPA